MLLTLLSQVQTKHDPSLPALREGLISGFGSLEATYMVGLFVSDVMVGKKEVQVGDQILEIAGQSAAHNYKLHSKLIRYSR